MVKQHLRVCFLSYKFAPFVGGAEVRAEKQARQLLAQGHAVTVVTLRLQKTWPKREVRDGLEVLRVGGIYNRTGQLRLGRLGHFPLDVAMFLTLWRLRHSYDVIHAFQMTTVAAVAALVGKLTHTPVIVSTQTSGPTEHPAPGQDVMLMADTLPQSAILRVDFRDWIATASEVISLPYVALGGRLVLHFLRTSPAFFQVLSRRGSSYLAAYGFPSQRIVHISGSVDTERFCPLLQARDPLQVERDILCVARLEYAKGVDVLIHAWGHLLHSQSLPRQVQPRLLLVGDGKSRLQLEYIARELGIQHSVKFLGKRSDVIALLQQVWGFVLPSRWEGMPNALLEAMACGLPCVATRVSGSEDLIVDGVNGLLVEPEQPAEMAEALRRLIEDPALAQRLAQEARTTVVQQYQLSHVVEQCVELYRRLLPER